ncbi:MAG: hypothetical protein H8E19_09200 [Deltaproteobacteria bacterium]|uniref:Radical SAM protein n=1 Tax=Candidatus Desulfacyla euxinica TaxID=2841693 RepID=A0A8J6MZR1_9DELT|nr:hypothetical protein [Candidatus Desulfacyla euxinica]
MSDKKKRMVIIASYFGGETYGLLGPQMAATVIQENTSYECIVVAVAREDDKTVIKKTLADYFGEERPVMGFSTLSGRQDLFALAKELKDEGAFTILAGPQADVDYIGETGWKDHDHRFKGGSDRFSIAMHGPAEQAIKLLENLDAIKEGAIPGLLCLNADGNIIQSPKRAWDQRFLAKVSWDNIYRVGKEGFEPIKINTGQVLQQIGCPHASEEAWVEIDYPAVLAGKSSSKVRIFLRGCSFCDVAVDKGFYGALDMETVLAQINCLPERADGLKIPFELINENALPSLPRLLVKLRERGVRLSQVNLTLRADWFLKGERWLREALGLAKSMGIRILLSSVGFESFDDRILRNLNKGLNVKTNLRTIQRMRRLKEEFPEEWGYSRRDGAIHGFIHPTPWDTEETWTNIQRRIDRYALTADILPDNSIPLIIHHASGLGDWIREVERKESCRFERLGSIIEWWQDQDLGSD